MPSISTHVLNSENGTHVAGLTVTLTHIEPDGAKNNIFSSSQRFTTFIKLLLEFI